MRKDVGAHSEVYFNNEIPSIFTIMQPNVPFNLLAWQSTHHLRLEIKIESKTLEMSDSNNNRY